MAEEIRECRFTLYIDTNKRTIEKTFDSLMSLNQYFFNLELVGGESYG